MFNYNQSEISVHLSKWEYSIPSIIDSIVNIFIGVNLLDFHIIKCLLCHYLLLNEVSSEHHCIISSMNVTTGGIVATPL